MWQFLKFYTSVEFDKLVVFETFHDIIASCMFKLHDEYPLEAITNYVCLFVCMQALAISS